MQGADLPAMCVAGTYDGGVVGWEQHMKEGKKTFKLVSQDSLCEISLPSHGVHEADTPLPIPPLQVFAFTPHQGSVRCLAIPQSGNKVWVHAALTTAQDDRSL